MGGRDCVYQLNPMRAGLWSEFPAKSSFRQSRDRLASPPFETSASSTLTYNGEPRQLTLDKIDSRLGGPRSDAKAAPEQETSSFAVTHLRVFP